MCDSCIFRLTGIRWLSRTKRGTGLPTDLPQVSNEARNGLSPGGQASPINPRDLEAGVAHREEISLYLLKIEMIPREAAWLPSLVFIAFIFPARLLSGWAFGRSLRRTKPRNWFVRWTARLAMLGVTLAYVVIVYFSQYAAWEGIWSLYEQHAFLLPVPFLGM